MTQETEWTEADTRRAMQFWEEYQKQHDVSALVGKAVGIEPKSGRVFFGEDIQDIMHRHEKDEGVWEPLLFLLVGCGYYWRKWYGNRVGEYENDQCLNHDRCSNGTGARNMAQLPGRS